MKKIFPPRDKLIFVLALLVSAAALCTAAIFGVERQKVAKSFYAHNFHRAAVIDLMIEQKELRGIDAMNLIASAPNPAMGAGALLTRDSARELLSLPEVDKVMGFSRSLWQLKTRSGESSEIWLFNIPNEFPAFFKFGDTALSSGTLVPSAALATKLQSTENTSSVKVGIPQRNIDSMPIDMRDRIDWTVAYAPMIMAPQGYDVPSDAPMFRNAVFTTGKNPQISIPGFFTIPSVQLMVTFKPGVDEAKAIARLKAFLATARPNVANGQLAIVPATEFFSEAIKVGLFSRWSATFAFVVALGCGLLILLIALIRLPQVHHEIALRRMLGVDAMAAAKLSMMNVSVSLGMGSLAGVVLGSLVWASLGGMNYRDFGLIIFAILCGILLSIALTVSSYFIIAKPRTNIRLGVA